MKVIISFIALFLVGAALAGCASSARITPVTEKPAIEVKSDQTAKPIQFRKIVMKLKRGEDIGSIRGGLTCIPNRELIYRGGKSTFGGDELTEIFHEELTAANYEVVGDPDALFDDPSAWKAELLVAGLVKSMKANVCFPMSGYGNLVDGTGEAWMQVDWQIYSRLNRKVVYETSTQGSGHRKKSQPDVVTEVFLDAFAQATRNLLADRGFHNLVTGTRRPQEAEQVGDEIAISAVPLSAGPLTDRVTDVRLRVATVLAGDGHGSGFFIDDKGHLVTNQHVVGEAKFVKIKLATGREVLGEVIRRDSRRDVALVLVEQTGITGLPIERSAPAVGSEVYAIGSPLGEELDTTVSKGIVSAFRTLDGLEFIQSDVNILPGNSGGPLLDERGNVVGVAVSGRVHGGDLVGLNFFVPIRSALEALNLRYGSSGTS